MSSGPWSAEDDKQLRELARSGHSLVEIAREMGRKSPLFYTRTTKLKIAVARDRNPMRIGLKAMGK